MPSALFVPFGAGLHFHPPPSWWGYHSIDHRALQLQIASLQDQLRLAKTMNASLSEVLSNAEGALEKQRDKELTTSNRLESEIQRFAEKRSTKELVSLKERVVGLAVRLGVERKVFVAHETLDDVEEKVVELVESLVKSRFTLMALQKTCREEKQMAEGRAAEREAELEQALQDMSREKGELVNACEPSQYSDSLSFDPSQHLHVFHSARLVFVARFFCPSHPLERSSNRASMTMSKIPALEDAQPATTSSMPASSSRCSPPPYATSDSTSIVSLKAKLTQSRTAVEALTATNAQQFSNITSLRADLASQGNATLGKEMSWHREKMSIVPTARSGVKTATKETGKIRRRM